MWKSFLNLIFPIKCIICDSYKTQREICSNCWGNIPFITKPYCYICGIPFSYENDEKAICGYCVMKRPSYDKSISIFKYNEYSKKIIHKFKYQDNLHILDYLVNLMSNLGNSLIIQADYIVPVPMHKYKLLKRGYNQSALLAMKIAKKNNVKYLPELLLKIKHNMPQASLKKGQRIENIKNTICINNKYKSLIAGKVILLVDDVITTGATIEECAKIISGYKPSHIFILSLAKNT
jgi:ComF family protein